MKTLRLILGDQLNIRHSWFNQADEKVCYLMMEIIPEANYAPHHRQKILAFFKAMRNFANSLQNNGHIVRYLCIDDNNNLQDFSENIRQQLASGEFSLFEYQEPDEYRLKVYFEDFCHCCSIETSVCESEHFLTDKKELQNFFKGKKTYVMESYYRSIRKKFNILMNGKEPSGGQWNFDQLNRNPIPDRVKVPVITDFKNDIEDLTGALRKMGIEGIGSADNQILNWPLTREQALIAMQDFAEKLLPYFGTYQDAMRADDPFLFHSRLSFALNTKMLHPLEVVRYVEAMWQKYPEKYDISQIEGFIRQIAGWREYMRGVYWANMPEYASLNYFGNQRKLPDFYWNGNTRMHCMAQSIGQSLQFAYAHHIQRLMVTGNFALLAGINPDEVDTWYLGIYIDAIEWVEITNTRGMSQYADGGIVGTKPYVSSANYISKMSNYCRNCYYDSKKRHGNKACPFNSLYWNFYIENRDLLGKNARIGMVYRTLDKMTKEETEKIKQQAKEYLENIEQL
ncbi:MAG: cryptochrome/photolyase family protein [Cyclobacteriaceae bacterium]|nr:cryptochrome/photolyase family protein [Cyclobacteriaceae bacterium]